MPPGGLVLRPARRGPNVLGIAGVTIRRPERHRLLRLLTLVLGEAERGFRLVLQPTGLVDATLTTSPFSQALEGGGHALLGGGHVPGYFAQSLLLVPDLLPPAFEHLLLLGARRPGPFACGLARRALAGPLHAPMISLFPNPGQGPVRLGPHDGLTRRSGDGGRRTA
jgi:hypothetical protein